MGAQLLILVAAALPQTHQDTVRTYATPATRELVERAAARHQAQDSAVTDYRARIRYRLSIALGRRRWARSPVAAVEEQEALVAWQLPNDLRVDVIGRRYRSRLPELNASSVFDRPWFVPRSVGDSVRIFSNEFPATGALHPLARGAEASYHYDLLDSLSVSVPGSGPIRLYSVQVTPKAVGAALVAGRLWLDASDAQVVRFTFRYVGTSLWVRPEGDDSGSARFANRLINRIINIDADLEYALQDGKYWMPYRQAIAGTVRIPIVSDVVIPFQAVTTFDDYEINTGTPIAFALPLPDSISADSARALRSERRDSIQAEREGGEGRVEGWHYADRWPGGRYEIHRPPNDSLALYTSWRDSLRFDNDAADDRRVREAQAELARIAEELPDELTGRSAAGFGYQNLGDALQYNRVQGLSIGVGGRVRVPGSDFTDLFATVRYGLSDERVTGRLAAVRDAPGGRLALSGYRDIADVDPFSPGRTFGNSLNAVFTAHDDADYLLATGGSLTYVTSIAIGTDLFATVRGERQRSVEREARSSVNDLFGGTGIFPFNPPVADGDFGIASLRIARLAGIRWSLAAEGMAGEGEVTGRAFGDIRYARGAARGYTLRVKAGVAESNAPPQMQFRLGGMQTVRGFQYGSLVAPAFWAAQLDVSPMRGTIRPIFFIDAGQAAPLGELLESRALVGGGVGVSVYSPLLRTTLLRLDLSHPISPDDGGEWRFDLVFSPVR